MATQGFGCMGLSAFFGSADDVTPEKAKTVIEHVVNHGVTLLNSATFYGPLNEVGYGANLRLLKTALADVDRNKVQLMVKIDRHIMGDTTFSRRAVADVDFALKQLGTDYLDIIVLCRVPSDTPIEEIVESMKAIVESGKAQRIGLSEASANTIRRAHAVYPLYCIEQEWSLWARDLEAEIVPTCRELGIKIVAYSPLGRGFLTGTIRSVTDAALGGSDCRKFHPKFSGGNLEKNLTLVEATEALAKRRGCTVGQLALAFLHAQGPDVIPIPGTTNPAHFDENYAAREIKLTPEELAEIDRTFTPDAVAGERYPGNHPTFHKN